MRLSIYQIKNARQSLAKLAEKAREGIERPEVVVTARRITNGCASRDELCELQSIYDAVKHGTNAVVGLEHGVRYVADPATIDFFTVPHRLLELCKMGACAEDCDAHALLNAALAGAIGFPVGLRVWGPPVGSTVTGENGKTHRIAKDEFSHIYAVAGTPKRKPTQVVALDTTVEQGHLGWEPPKGQVLTAWITGEDD